MSTPSRSGVLGANVDTRVEKFTESVSFDRRLYAHDIVGSQAHARMLAKVGLISGDECREIEQTLSEIRQEIEQGEFHFDPALEDIHMHVEHALVERLGDVGRKLHTARSRNDQVSTDLRMWTREAIDTIDRRLADLMAALVARCERDEGVILPAYTHLRRAQPVLAAHAYLCHVERLARDRGRLADARRRVNVLPLGGGALAGTSLPIDREMVRRELEFDAVAANSLDTSSDRDFVAEVTFAWTMIAEHLSSWAEEWILWSTTEFDFLALPQEFCTCSSMMPQKINPDVLELVRGKTGRLVGNLMSLLTLLKGLPPAYNRDLQEDKEPLFDSFDTIDACLELAAAIVAGAELKQESIAERLEAGFLDATTLMEHLIGLGVPQRTAHHAVGSLVAMAAERGVALAELSLEEMRSVDPALAVLDERVFEFLGTRQAVAAFASFGSTSPERVAEQVTRWKQELGI
ncbi:MAG: argininosuccinate lyase [Planctomycetota bacterium]|nr:MAG: argininosuccinate lyase [Planctomycetota bacterium]REJ87857.1 MAG: argininosuccinate lyase [Planctomycetota bacterium]REK26433.1 MAG: argininosuccinate lyase [Planctomycetota bacterium]REK43276.1 MAG: argininosuccinate lyase [Planctomycetota bacterium]